MITIELIDEFRKRTNSSYEDAKYFLEKNNGDILEAIIDFERTKASKFHNHRKHYHKDFGQSFADVLQKGFDTRIVVEDNNSVLFSIPLIFMFFLIPMWVLMLLFFAFLYILGYKFSIRDIKNQNINVNAFFRTIGDRMKEYNTHTKQNGNANYNAGPNNAHTNITTYNPNYPAAPETSNDSKDQDKDNEDGYKEYTIE
ncbi:MAG: hypothetical protein GXX10_05635 [Clostridiaceae bacterium]|nr:hypothetical protein [Clostridiaceae bacterium]